VSILESAAPTFGIVPSPPAVPPVVGLIPSLGPDNLIDDTGVVIDGHENRWEAGLQYLPEQVCSAGGVGDPCGDTVLNIPPNPNLVQTMPFIVWAGDQCSTFGWRGHDFVGRATRALLATESYQISKEFWGGAQAAASHWPNFYLANEAATIVTAGPVSPSVALAMLEEGIAQHSNGQPGMIHCTRQMGVALSELGNTYRQLGGNLIVTYMGTIINPDAGNPGTGPSGDVPRDGSQWAYATLLPTVRRSPISVIPDEGAWEEALFRRTNLLEWRAERLAAVAVPDCVHVAAQIDLPLALTAGGAS
jgi:hypothetical protein